MQHVLVDLEAERAVLGTLLADPELLTDVSELRVEDFGDSRNGIIFEAMSVLGRAGRVVNHLSVAEWLHDAGKLSEAGGPDHLLGLEGAGLIQLQGLREQVDRLRDFGTRRHGMATLQRVAEELRNLRRPADEVVLEGCGQLATLSSRGPARLKTATEIMHAELDRIEAIQKGEQQNVSLIPTGIKQWDELLGGLPRGFVTVEGGQAGVGKSAVMASMALSIAEGGPGRPPEEVGFFSLEDRGNWMVRRYLAERGEVAIRQLLRPGLEQEKMERVFSGASGLSSATDRIWIDDRRGLTAHRVGAEMRRLHAQRGVRVFFIDHLLEMLDKRNVQQRDLAIGEILDVLRDAAIELDAAVVLGCHLRDPENPAVDARYLRPKLQDFAGSQFINRMARVAVGFWQAAPPQEPKPPKEIPEPRRLVRMKDDEWRATLEKHESVKAKAQKEYEKSRGAWEDKCKLYRDSLVVTVLKVTEGTSGFDFTLRRVTHAGLVSRDEGAHRPEVTGYSPPPR